MLFEKLVAFLDSGEVVNSTIIHYERDMGITVDYKKLNEQLKSHNNRLLIFFRDIESRKILQTQTFDHIEFIENFHNEEGILVVGNLDNFDVDGIEDFDTVVSDMVPTFIDPTLDYNITMPYTEFSNEQRFKRWISAFHETKRMRFVETEYFLFERDTPYEIDTG